MPQSRQTDRRAKSGPRVAPLAMLASGSAAALLALSWHDAARFRPAGPQRAVELAQNALHQHGYDWARVSLRGNVVHIMGKAPDDGARVMAYHMARQALRPLMGQDASVEDIRSHLTLAIGAEPANGHRIEGAPALDVASILPPPMPLVHSAEDHSGTASIATAEGVPAELAPDDARSAHADEAAAPIETASTTKTSEPAAPHIEQAAPQAQFETTQAQIPATGAAHTPPAPSAQPAAERVQTAALDLPPSGAGKQSPEACAQIFSQALSAATIQFARDSAAIVKESRPLLDRLAAIAKHCRAYRLTVEGHTDLTGSRTHNMELSRKRAEAVRWALVDRGVDMDHVTAEGYGAIRPLEEGTSEAANARNRRIVISVAQ